MVLIFLHKAKTLDLPFIIKSNINKISYFVARRPITDFVNIELSLKKEKKKKNPKKAAIIPVVCVLDTEHLRAEVK